MALVAKCSICGEMVNCANANRLELMEHIREKHPIPSAASREKLNAPDKKHVSERLDSCEEMVEPESNRTSKKSTEGDDKNVISPTSNKSPPIPRPRSFPQNDGEKQSSKKLIQSSAQDDEEKRSRKKLMPSDGNGDNGKQCFVPKGNQNYIKPKTAEQIKGAQCIQICGGPSLKNLLAKKKSSRNSKLYRTTVEKWRPGIARIHCPKCGVIRRPIIKSTQNRVARSPAGAACILACWPFCFLPFLFPPPIQEKLYCRSCNYFIGAYDYKLDQTIPHKESDT